MRVLIDGYNLQLEEGTGVATYSRSLCRLVKNMGHSVEVLYGRPGDRRCDPLLNEVEFFDRPSGPHNRWSRHLNRAATAAAACRRGRPVRVPTRGAVLTDALAARMPAFDELWNQAALFESAALRHRVTGGLMSVDNQELRVDLAHWTYPLPLRVAGAANVYTLHDLVPLRLPYATLDHKADYLRLLRTIARTADLILTVSEASRRDIVDWLEIDEERVVNTYQPVLFPQPLLETSEAQLAEILRGVFGLELEGYVLAYGAVEPKKNFGRLIEAYLAADLDIPLVIAGPDGWMVGKELALLDDERQRVLINEGTQLRVKRRVQRIGYVPHRQLINLIRGARCVAFPSLYEGFGLPIAEAMRCGTAVLTSGLGATAEIAGEAAVLVDPYDTDAIRRGLSDLCNDSGLRDTLVRSGHERCEHFSPEACAGRLAQAYANAGIDCSPA